MLPDILWLVGWYDEDQCGVSRYIIAKTRSEAIINVEDIPKWAVPFASPSQFTARNFLCDTTPKGVVCRGCPDCEGIRSPLTPIPETTQNQLKQLAGIFLDTFREQRASGATGTKLLSDETISQLEKLAGRG